jgi:hypothetical protein
MSKLKIAEKYVGTPYVKGMFDCADLAVKVQREVFGRNIDLPAHEQTRAGQEQQIGSLRYEKAEPIKAPTEGCGVLLTRIDPKGLVWWHIGTVFFQADEPWVLHNSEHLKSAALQRLSYLMRSGFRVEGWYAWK